MANIQEYLRKIKSAIYGRDVRDSIHDAIDAINTEVEEAYEEIDEFVQGEMDTTLTSTELPAQGKAVGDAIEDVVIASDTQPTSEFNQIWIDEDGETEYQVPTYSEFSEVKNALSELPKNVDDDAIGVDLDITDPSGNVLVRFEGGHIETKEFSSEDILQDISDLDNDKLDANQGSQNVGKALVVQNDGSIAPEDISVDVDDTLSQQGEAADAKAVGDAISSVESVFTSTPTIKESDAVDVDLDVVDAFGNVVARFSDGQIKTKNFDSNTLQEAVSDIDDAVSDVTKDVNNMKRVRTRMGFGAHNGAEYYAPECTIPAYRIAGQQGWEWAWIAGISFSAEGSMYVLHDGTVDRTTDGTGSITTLTDAQIDALNITQTGAGYDLSDFDPAELKIPTFEQVVQQCVKYGMKMVIRLSDFPNGTNTEENKAKWDGFMEVINGYGVQPEDISCYLDTGTKAATCRALIGDNVEISTHLGINATAQDFVDWFESRSITGRKAAILSYQNTNLEAVKLLHTHGIRVYSYGYNSQEQADNCALWGVDIYQNGKIYKITE